MRRKLLIPGCGEERIARFSASSSGALGQISCCQEVRPRPNDLILKGAVPERFSIWNFGCRASQADGAAIAAQLTAAGHEAVTAGGHDAAGSGAASLVVLNSCTVTAAADQDLEKAIRRTRRDHPGAQILVTGCYAQREPERLASLDGVTWVVGNSDKDRIAEIVASLDPASSYHAQIHVRDIFSRPEFFSAPIEAPPEDRARPNLKIQDGCNNRCSFCVIPSVRGSSRSASATWVLEQVRRLSERYAEVVLTGVNLGRWGREQGGGRQLESLLRQILAETGVRRLRLSSIEPMDWTDQLIGLMASEPRIARHVHAPLQSGSDTVLRRMFRKYRPRHYRERLERAYALMPDAAFGADVMTGFPGETDAEFAETVAFIRDLPLTYLHVFTYSERPGTRAAGSGNPVPAGVRRQRTHILRALSEDKNRKFREQWRNRLLSVVTLGDRAALSSNYIPVTLASPAPAQEIREVRVTQLTSSGMAEAALLPVL